jgi:diguanylate cyclase (GGDEF)-like protein
MALANIWIRAVAAPKRWLGHATEPHILFPAIACLGLIAIWGTTLNLIKDERAAAERSAALLAHDLSETYEAQVVRALREIDQTLKVVQYAYELRGRYAVLQELKVRSLLPPDLLFAVSIADSKGDIEASTRASARGNIAGADYFLLQRGNPSDTLQVGRAQQDKASGEWQLQFSRRLTQVEGSFSGIAMVSVGADYFVSGYEPEKLGQYGVLGILGTDGVFRVRRSGDAVSAGDAVDYATLVPSSDEDGSTAKLTNNTWDGVRRYITAQSLYDFPLAVIVGLSEDEQLEATRRDAHTFLWRASFGSALLILLVAVLQRLSEQLASSRRQAAEGQVAYAKRVEYLAYHDGLTDLPNRSLFSRLLIQSIKHASRYERQLAVLFLDLDRFKHVNDTLGHEAGDQLLKEVATRLKTCLRDSDSVARLGGDEFVALLPELNEQADVALVARKILAALAQPFVLLGQEFRITASVGISCYPQDGLDEQTLTKNADIAMYKAKEEGKNNFQFYSEKMHTESLERLTLESALRNALERREFQLHYQTKREIRSGRITGLEALLRWQHPDLGLVAPMRFLPIAEETGLIVPIGKWVFRTACLQTVAWQNQGLPHLSMAINLTARQFLDEHLLRDLLTIFEETGMDPRLLELEIHESLLMRDVAKTLRILAALKAEGIRIAVDDFGIGYSSLGTLKQFPLDTIKIDRTFIRDVTSVPADKALTEAIIAMGRTLSLTVVAQGVETKEQADFLRKNACDEFQGFYLNRPLPEDQIADLLRKQLTLVDGHNPAAA